MKNQTEPKTSESVSTTSIIQQFDELHSRMDINEYLQWSSRMGIGCTPLVEIPEEVNPHAQNGIRIFYKPEFLNRGGSGKGRPVSFMLYYYLKKGMLQNIKMITTAGFGNFMRTLTTLLPLLDLNILPKAHMGQILINENPDLIKYLRRNRALIEVCSDGYCPTGDMNRGKAIANAYIEEQTEEAVLMLDQHGVFKPFDGLLNAASYYYGLAPEIIHQTSAMRNVYYVNGQGTRGSLIGTAAGLKKAKPEITIIGLRQQEEGHIFGLRSLKQLGKSDSLGNAEELCDAVYDVSDREAYATMMRLWKAGIPATPSGGSYIAGALRLADSMDERGNIITLVFDSLEFYQSLLTTWVPKILGHHLDVETFRALTSRTLRDRATHTRTLEQGKSALKTAMQPS